MCNNLRVWAVLMVYHTLELFPGHFYQPIKAGPEKLASPARPL